MTPDTTDDARPWVVKRICGRRWTPSCVTREIVRTPDFIEGVRAALVDKDRQPCWEHSRYAGLDANGRSSWTALT